MPRTNITSVRSLNDKIKTLLKFRAANEFLVNDNQELLNELCFLERWLGESETQKEEFVELYTSTYNNCIELLPSDIQNFIENYYDSLTLIKPALAGDLTMTSILLGCHQYYIQVQFPEVDDLKNHYLYLRDIVDALEAVIHITAEGFSRINIILLLLQHCAKNNLVLPEEQLELVDLILTIERPLGFPTINIRKTHQSTVDYRNELSCKAASMVMPATEQHQKYLVMFLRHVSEKQIPIPRTQFINMQAQLSPGRRRGLSALSFAITNQPVSSATSNPIIQSISSKNNKNRSTLSSCRRSAFKK